MTMFDGQAARTPTRIAHLGLEETQSTPTRYARAGRGRLQTPSPHPVKALEVERRGEQVPFRKDVVASSKKESSSAVTLFEEAKDWLDKSLAPPIKVLGRIGGHQLPVSLQQRLMFAHAQGAPVLVFGAFPKRRAGPAYLALGSVPSEEVAVLVPERVLVSELLPLRAQVGVGLRAVSELVFVVRKTTLAIMALGHQHPVSRRLAISKVGPRMVSRIGKGHGPVPVFSVVRRGLDHRDQLRLVVRVSRQANSRDDHARAFSPHFPYG